MYGSGSGPLAIAHRGGAALAAENTLAAFGRSYDLGIRYLETDVRLTRDGVPIAFHDASLARVTGLRRAVRELTWSQVHELDPRIPRLDALLASFPDACFAVDLKDRCAINPLVAVLRETGAATRVCVAGAHDGWLTRVQREVPVTVALGWHSLTRLLTATTRSTEPGFAHVPRRLVDRRLLHRAHGRGLRVVVWTVDDPTQMRGLLAAGADGIITDRPDILRDVLIERGEWRPPSRTLSAP